MNRHLTTYDITWFLETARNNRLDLDPPYQRRSVWTRKDKQFFLDTIFRNYPSPAIFLHKTLDENGRATYHVVDGKQRIQTILDFANGKVAIAEDYGDSRLNSKRWSDLKGESELRFVFWNYKIIVEEIDFGDDLDLVNNIFDRINRNARKLTRQELRHAKYDGWFLRQVEAEAEHPAWKNLRVVTPAREKRMADSQFLSELMLVILEHKMRGFDQDALDDAYANYDDIDAAESTVDADAFAGEFARVKGLLLATEEQNQVITTYCRSIATLYTVWSVLALEQDLPPQSVLADRLRHFFQTLQLVSLGGQAPNAALLDQVGKFADNLRGASTDLGPRMIRYDALADALRTEL